jgi:hypothetical protein
MIIVRGVNLATGLAWDEKVCADEVEAYATIKTQRKLRGSPKENPVVYGIVRGESMEEIVAKRQARAEHKGESVLGFVRRLAGVKEAA